MKQLPNSIFVSQRRNLGCRGVGSFTQEHVGSDWQSQVLNPCLFNSRVRALSAHAWLRFTTVSCGSDIRRPRESWVPGCLEAFSTSTASASVYLLRKPVYLSTWDQLHNIMGLSEKWEYRALCLKIIKHFKIATAEHLSEHEILLSSGPCGTLTWPQHISLNPLPVHSSQRQGSVPRTLGYSLALPQDGKFASLPPLMVPAPLS